jgi:hypothetical protein
VLTLRTRRSSSLAAVGALAVDQALGSRVDRGYAVDLAQHGVLRCPKADAVGDRAIECTLGVGIGDQLAQLAERRVLAERLADRVDQVEPRAEVLIEGRTRDAGRSATSSCTQRSSKDIG